MSVGAREDSMAKLIELEFKRIRPGANMFEFPAFYAASMRAMRMQLGLRFPRKKGLQELELAKLLRSIEKDDF